jgi:hypothetical protein
MQMVLRPGRRTGRCDLREPGTCAAETGLQGPHGPGKGSCPEASGDLAVVPAGTSAAIASIPTSANGLVLSAMHDQCWS